MHSTETVDKMEKKKTDAQTAKKDYHFNSKFTIVLIANALTMEKLKECLKFIPHMITMKKLIVREPLNKRGLCA